MATSSRQTFRRSIAALGALALSLLSCGREITGPTGRLTMHGFSFAPRFADLSMANGVAGDLVAFDRVRVVLVNGAGTTVLTRIVNFPSTATEVPLELSVPLTSDAATGEQMDLSLAFINAQGDTVFRGGPLSVNVIPNERGSQPPPPVDVPVVYSGVGANAASVVIDLSVDTLVAGASFSYTATARDGQGAVIANTPIAWRVATAGKATLASQGAGAGTTLATRGEALIIAQSLTGQADTLRLEILPLAQSIAIESGNNQTALLGAPLPSPLEVRVTATDGQPMAGVAVAFAVTTGGGSLSQLADTTDASGIASVEWTTGSAITAQTVTATASGLTGSPLTFTAQPPVLTLTRDVDPSLGVVGAPLSPPVQISVRDANENVVTSFTGDITITIAAGTAGAVLGGTTTKQAVAGVATFSDLTIDRAGTTYRLLASAPSLSLTSSPTPEFSVTVAPPTQLAFTQVPSSASAGVTIDPAITVEARDAVGNVVPSYTGEVTLAFEQGSGALLGTLTVNAVGGVASFADIAITGVLAATQLRATAAGLTTAVTSPFPVSAGPAARLEFFGGVPTPILAGQPIAPIIVRALDAFDNIVPTFNSQVTLGLGTAPAGILSGTVQVNATNGLATFTGLSLSAPGVGFTLVASSSGLPNEESDPFTVDAFAFSNAWINTSGGNWSNPLNWSLGRTPAATDTVVVGASGTYTVTMDVSDTVAFLVLGPAAGVQTLSMGTRQLRVDSAAFVLANGVLQATTGSIVGGGVVENLGQIVLTGGLHAFTLENAGRFTLRSNVAYNGTLTTTETSIIESLAESGPGAANPTMSNGFTNNGLLELRTTGAFFGNNLVISGTLVNSSTGVIRSVAGFGSKALSATLDNQGLIEINEGTTINRGGAFHVNSGTILIAGGTLTLSQFGVTPSFTNTGTITVSAGRALNVTGGTLNLTGGTLEGWGGSLTTSGVTMNFDINSVRMPMALVATTVPGTFTIPAGDSLLLTDGSPTMTLVNEGRLVLRGNATLNGSLTTATTSVIESRAQNGPGGAATTITNGFVNNGLIELRTLDAFYGNSLAVGGTLVNSPTGVIRTVAGLGAKSLSAQLDNQGLVDVVEGLTLARASAVHLNTGTIQVAGASLTVTQTGTTPSFTNTGSITVAAGRSLSVTGGTLNLTGGTLTGWSGELNTGSVTLNFDINSARLPLSLSATTVPGTFTIPAGDSLVLVDGSPTMTLVNEGRLVLMGGVMLNGTLTTAATSVVESRAQNGPGGATTTITTGFVNNGLIELRTLDAFYGNSLTVGGTLVNAPAGVIRSVAGFGAKTLSAQLDNQGVLDVVEGLTLARASAVHVNSGSIALATANLTITQSGTTPSFTNSGSITLSAGRALNVNGGTLNLTGGTLTGWSGQLVTTNVTLNFDINAARMPLDLTATTVPGTFTIPAGDSLILNSGSPTMTLINEGRLVLRSNVALNGSLTTVANSFLEVRAQNGPGGVSALITNGFVNNGVIELRTLNAFYGNSLTVGGTLVNSSTGEIRSIAGFGAKTLSAQLDNQGVIQLDEGLTLSRASATHVNSGTILLAGSNLTVTQTGTTPSFSNAGTITLSPGRVLTVTGGTLNLTGGTLEGWGGRLSTTNVTLNFDINAARMPLDLASTTVPGTFTIPAGDSLVLDSGSPTFTLVNEGLLVLRGTNVLGGSLTTSAGSVIENRAQNGPGSVNTTITNGFTNNGSILLRTLDAFYGNSLTVGGTLVNSALGEIVSTAGFGGKTLAAQIDNQGVIEILSALTINRASAAHVNNGVITVSGDDFNVTQSGTTPSFVNSGSITIGAGRSFTATGGSLTLTGGTLEGWGGRLITNGVALAFNVASAQLPVTLSATTIAGLFTVPAGDSLVLEGGSPTFGILSNAGRLVLRGNATLGGTLTTEPTSIIESRAQNGPGTANTTITGGFINNGVLELRTEGAFYGNTLTVGGTLINESTGVIRSVAGFGGKTLTAQIANLGLIEVNEALTINRASANHSNGGTIVVSGANLTFTQSGTSPSFVNNAPGTIQIAATRSIVFGGGAVDLRPGSVTGAGTVASQNTTAFQLNPATFAPRLNITGTATSASPITIAAGDSLRVNGGTFAPSALTVDGTLIVEGTHSLTTSGLAINSGGLMLVRSSNATAGAALTLNAPLTTNGTVRLTSIDANRSTSMTLAAFALNVGATGSLELLAGAGGTRSISSASIDNNGTISVAGTALIGGAIAQRNAMNVAAATTVTLQNPLTLFTGSVTTNLGTLNLTGGCALNGSPTFSGFLCP